MRVLLLHLEAPERDSVAAALRDDGHDVVAVAAAPSPPAEADVIVVCLDAQPQRTLDLAAKVGAESGVPATSLLFAGGSSGALQEAQQRFPKASFCRVDALSTALASMAQ
jgi:hypothetical protein